MWALVELNDLNHLRGQSTEIESGVFRLKEQFCTDRFLISSSDQKLFTVKYNYSNFLLKVA